MKGDNKPWTPLMFNGTMYGVKDSSALWYVKDGETKLNLSVDKRPVIDNVTVIPATNDNGELDVSTNAGVGFFGTVSAKFDTTNFLTQDAVVCNIHLKNVKVVNDVYRCDQNETLINGLLTGVGGLLGTILDGTTNIVLGGKTLNLKGTLMSLLNARKNDPSSLATGAFAGRVVGNVVIKDCLIEQCSVKTVITAFEDGTMENQQIVGKGGFVGYVQGNFQYDGLSTLLGGATDTLAGVLNLIPGVGLGDLVTILLDNGIPTNKLIPSGYSSPTIDNCEARTVSLSKETGKLGVGGFVGTQCGSTISNCRLSDSTLEIVADSFGGGFAGVERDDIIKATLGDLGVIAGKLYPQSELNGCSILRSSLTISGGDCLGGFIGVQANSYAITDIIDSFSSVTISSEGSCIGGISGRAQLGSSFGLSEYLMKDSSVLSTVKDLLTGALSENPSQALLELAGVSQSAILGCRIECPLSLTTSGSKIGGIVGSGEAVTIARSTQNNIRQLNKYNRTNNGEAPSLPDVTEQSNVISSISDVHAGTDFAGGAAGHHISANTGSLLGDTLGLKSYKGFRLSDVVVNGKPDGFTVSADRNYAGGAVGFAIGGDVGYVDGSYEEPVSVTNLSSVTSFNHAGGFVGTTGPDKVAGGNGLDLNLLGLDVLKVNNLVGLTSGVHTNFVKCTVSGIQSGFTVSTTGARSGSGDKTDFTAGGFAGDTTSIHMTDCYVNNLLSVTSHDQYGMAGGFVGYSTAGSLSGVSAENDPNFTAIDLQQLVQLEADLIPTYQRCEVTFVDDADGFVKANAAGGFTGEFRSGTVNLGLDESQTNGGYAVHNIDHVVGGTFAGGFGGKVFSGALLRDGGSGISLLGSLDVDITGLMNITQQYLPVIRYAGVDSEKGFTVYAAYAEDKNQPSTAGYAGGFIGYGSGMEVSYCNVKSLKHRNVSVPDQLEDQDGSQYMTFNPSPTQIPYSVAGSRYAGGYIGYMNVGSATELGDGLKLLGEEITITDVIKGLDVVVSTIEHSDVYGCAGGYSVLASSHVNLGNGSYDDAGVGFAGGFAGKMLGAHVQNSNAYNFAYIIGEIASGGYAGDMEPGDVADLLDYNESDGIIKTLLEGVINDDDL